MDGLAYCAVFSLTSTAPSRWIPIDNGRDRYAGVTLQRRGQESAVFDLKWAQAEGSIIEVTYSFEWVQIQPDFFEAFAPAMQKRVGIYCLDADHGARLHAAVTEAVLTLICEKARALPPPSKLTHRAKLVYNEEWARYEAIPDSWSELNCQFGANYKLLHQSVVQGYESRICSLLVVLRRELVNNNGLQVEGIFRVAADAAELNAVKASITTGKFTGYHDPHVIANLIKIFFREMPARLIDLYMVARLDSAVHCDPMDVLAPVTRIPQPYQSLIIWLLDLMVDVVLNEDVNRMSPKGIAVVMTPNLISNSCDERAFAETQLGVQIVESLVRSHLRQRTDI